MVQAWMMADIAPGDDQRKLHQKVPNEPVSLEQLAKLGVFYWKLDATMCVAQGVQRTQRTEFGGCARRC